MVSAALRDIRVGDAGVQQHQQLPRLRQGGQDYGKTFTAAEATNKLIPSLIVSLIFPCLQVNNVPGGVCDYLYGRDVDRTGKFCAGGSVDACQVMIVTIMSLVTAPLVIVVLSSIKMSAPASHATLDSESLGVISHKDGAKNEYIHFF